METYMDEASDKQSMRPESDFNYFQNNMMWQQNNFLQWQFDPAEVITKLSHHFRGDVLDEETGLWSVQGDAFRLMNDKGINRLIGLYQMHVGKDFAMNYLKEERILQIMKVYAFALIDTLVLWQEEFEIDPRNFEYIYSCLVDSAFANLFGALEGFRTKQLVSSYRSTEVIQKRNTNDNQGGNQRKFLGIPIPGI
jgi:hypothetical protein